MKTLWCWRCGAMVPMLDEEEWKAVQPELSNAIRDIKDYRIEMECSLQEMVATGMMQAIYRNRTGLDQGEAIWHHRLSKYGHPCAACGAATPGANAGPTSTLP